MITFFCGKCSKQIGTCECPSEIILPHYPRKVSVGGSGDTLNPKQHSERLTLPIDSQERKNYPLLKGCLNYFPAALAGVARISKLGNEKHNPGEELHHARGKSMDHGDCIVRHLMDLQDLLAAMDRNEYLNQPDTETILTEASSLAWRALALSQELHERFGAPLAPGARVQITTPGPKLDKPE